MWAVSGLFGRLEDGLARIERESGGRLGVVVLDILTGERIGQGEHERFPMCSTFKLLAAAAILSRVDGGRESLARKIAFAPSDLVEYSPVTGARVGEGSLSLVDLCQAAMTVSDNTASNLLLATLGGPAGLTAYARSLGDEVTRLERIEPDLNEAIPDDPRDTTTPAAMLTDMHELLLGSALSASSKEHLSCWLSDNKTGDARLRAGLPKSWRVGDKTRSGQSGTTNDVGVIWPPGRPPILVTVYLTGTTASGEQRNAALAAVGRALTSALAG